MKIALLTAAALLPAAVFAQSGASCSTHSGAQPPALVEL